MGDNYFRLVTRSDFDGLVCAVLLKELDMIDDIKFAHPKDMQDGTILISDTDITTNLPYVEGVRLAFDHHSSEITRVEDKKDNYINDPQAPSAARVVYDHFGGKEKFPNVSDDMMEAVDKGDSAQFSEDEIVDAKGWALLNYLMDSRTGLGRFREFRVSNYNLMMQLIDFCRDHTVDDIFDLPDVKEQIKRGTTAHGNLAVLDLRDEETIYAGNRFMIYALFPDTNISIHVLWGLNKLNTVFATGKSIINRTSKTNIGDLMLKYGGGGHESAGTCQIENDDAERVLSELIEQITADG
ncbi:MAG: exopolyphosphatase [Pseudomonadota bacterium]|nr:exopolyphosphatase [Pseudomonadota bacterium]